MPKKVKSAPEKLPASIDAIPDAMLRYRATEAWWAVLDVEACIEAWSRWVEGLAAGTTQPSEATLLERRVGLALNRLLGSGAVDPGFSPAIVVGMFPQLPRRPEEEYLSPGKVRDKWREDCWRRMHRIREHLRPHLEQLRIALESGPLGVFEAQPVAVDLLPLVPAPPPRGKDPTAPRNAKFIEGYEAEGTPTYHSPAGIARWWRGLSRDERAEICPARPGLISPAGVKQAIKRTRKSQDNG